jgi:bifunctional non-homologous end joining protein LigD
MIKQQAELKIDGKTVSITSLDKPLWPDRNLSKLDYLNYISTVGPRMLPFIENRLLTVVRYPHGTRGESFYQKNCPDYAPDFVKTDRHDDINYIVCSDMASLLWLGNQLAFEFHVPFETINSKGPSEIVFDLDPPSRDEFSLSVKAALMLKQVLDKLNLISFVKTSGNKGIQLYLPLPENTFSYDDTRKFTQFSADYLTQKEPNLFTTERLKKNRGKKLYVDYIQHSEGKTIIAPYSVRGNNESLVATPLFWDEVNDDLTPEMFPLDLIKGRLAKKGCPFEMFFEAKKKQPFQPVLDWLQSQT